MGKDFSILRKARTRNESRYIDKEALGIGRADRNAFTVPEYAGGWNSAIDIITNAPAADVEEVRHGEWIRYGQDYKQCSLCGKVNTNYNNNNFCPNCGAKMNYNFGEDAK